MILDKFEPQEVLKHFEAISQIPRGSGNEKAVSDYIKTFAEGLGLEVIQDKWNNLIVRKPATPGYEGKTTVMLQAHLDMVCEMNTGTVHDFLKDPLDLYVEGDIIKARGTTLGADNGLGVAMCMAVLEAGDIQHPPLEIVLTTDEEAGMSGAYNLDETLLKSRMMLNLDSGDEREFVMGCAAGTMAEYLLPVEWEANSEPTHILEVKGLKGGHSGADIAEDRGNALRILGHVLAVFLVNLSGMKIASVSGGMKVNAIPREASATVVVTSEIDLATLCKEFAQQHNEKDLEITLTPCETASKVMNQQSAEKLIASLLLLPQGVISMSRDIEGLPNASCNMGVLETLENDVKISIMPRGSAKFYNQHTEAKIKSLANVTGAQLTFSKRSPAWPYNPDSKLMKIAQQCYKEMFNREPIITATHGGLECGILIDKIPEMDILSIGPNTYDIHTPEEGASIESTGNVWRFLKAVLRGL